MAQLLLLPDPRPLDDRLGSAFFRTAPKRPGVYLMRDANEKVLYVGKAKSLRSRLQNYRIANPDKMPRRHLKMCGMWCALNFASRITKQRRYNECELIRTIKPKFNRAGVWPSKTKFIVWQVAGDALELAVRETPQPGWQRFGPLNSIARFLHQTLARLLWLAVNANRPWGELPAGWTRGNIPESVAIHCPQSAMEIAARLDSYFGKSPDEFILWLGSQFSRRIHAFERAMIEAEFKILTDFAAKQKRTPQLALI